MMLLVVKFLPGGWVGAAVLLTRCRAMSGEERNGLRWIEAARRRAWSVGW